MKDISPILEHLSNAFNSTRVFQFVAPAIVRDPKAARPMDSWSFANRLLVLLQGATDARGFRQWEALGRHVTKGARALYILAPILKTRRPKAEPQAPQPATDQDGQPERATFCAGFVGVPVFRLEDTDGEPMPTYDPPEPPPLFEVASAWNIPVRYGAAAPGVAVNVFGCYSYRGDGEKRISLMTHDLYTFLHELAHAAHHRLTGDLSARSKVDKEIVAEFSAAVLGRVLGQDNPDIEESALAYCRNYAARTGSPGRALLAVLGEVESVCRLILDTASSTLHEGAA